MEMTATVQAEAKATVKAKVKAAAKTAAKTKATVRTDWRAWHPQGALLAEAVMPESWRRRRDRRGQYRLKM
jgi:hypothetical protein